MDRITDFFLSEEGQTVIKGLILASVGFFIELGKSYSETEPPPARIVIARSVSTAGLAMSALLLQALVPEAPLWVLVGGAALLGSLGVSFAERFIHEYMQKHRNDK